MTTRLSVPIREPYGPREEHRFADEVFETKHHTESLLLGPDGRPLRYAPRQKLGFDLRPRKDRE